MMTEFLSSFISDPILKVFYLEIKKYCLQLRLIVRVATIELDSVNLRVVREGGVSFRLKAADKRVAWRTYWMRK